MEKWKEHRSGKLPRKLNTSLLKCAHTKSGVNFVLVFLCQQAAPIAVTNTRDALPE